MNIKKVLSTLTLGGVLAASIAGAGVLAAEATDTVKTTPLGTYKKLVQGKTILLFKLAQEGDVISVSDVENAFPGKTVIATEDTLGTGDEVTVDGATYTIVVYGDANGDGVINTGDAIVVKKYAAELTELTDVQKVALELNGDEKINTGDAIRIQQVAVGNMAVEQIVNKQIPAKEGVTVEKIEIESATKLTVTLSDVVENAKFYVDGKLVSTVTNVENVYTLTVPTLTSGKEYTLKVTDKTASFEETKTFTYRKLVAPVEVTIAATETNNFADVNAGNVKNATVLVTFATINGIAETLEVTIKDEDDKTVTLTKELTGFETEVRFDNVDLSALKEGALTLKATLKDDQGNSATSLEFTAEKRSDAPIVKTISVTRSSATAAKIETLKTTETDALYYMVKEAGQTAPTAKEVIDNGTLNKTSATTSETISVTITNGSADKAYVVYIVPVTATGTYTNNVVEVKVSKVVDADHKLAPVTGIAKKTGTESTFEWAYDETAEGFVGYKAVLKLIKDEKGTAISPVKTKAEKTINKGEAKEVNFFDEMKKEAGIYVVEIIALADNVDYADSAVAKSAETKVESIATTVKVEFDKDVKTLLKWSMTPQTNITKVNDYTVEVAKYNSKTKKFDVISTANTTATTYDIASIVNENGIGEYTTRVIANAKEDALLVSKASAVDASKGLKYYVVESIKDLAVSKVNGKVVTLTATTLPDVYSTKPKYTLYIKEAGKTYDDSVIAPEDNITAFPYEVQTSLENGKEYCFKLVTTVNNVEYVSNETTVEIEGIVPFPTTALTYVKYEPQSAVEPTADLTDTNQITYNGDTLYMRGTTAAITTVTTENSTAASVIDMLKQMSVKDTKKGTADTVTITNNAISKVTLIAPEEDTTLDLTKLPKTATVEVTGNEKGTTTIKGELNGITLKGAKAKFDLSGLTVVNPVAVTGNNTVLTAQNNTILNLTDKTTPVSIATVNGVVLTEKTEPTAKSLGTITIKEAEFDIPGGANAISVDTTKVDKDITLNFTAKAQTGKVSILANEVNTVKVTTNLFAAKEIEVLGGKVDFTDARTTVTSLKALGGTKGSKVILVTDKVATESAIDEELATGTAEVLIEGSSFKFVVDVAKGATYTVNEGSNEVILNILKDKTVTITK